MKTVQIQHHGGPEFLKYENAPRPQPEVKEALATEIPGYAKLQREIHKALRTQHPEWIEANGESPMCDSYDARFADLLVRHQSNSRQTRMSAVPMKEKLSFQKPRLVEIVLA